MSIRIDGTNTTANPGITGADTDTGLQFGTNEVKVVTGGSDRVTVDSSGRVGIGDTSPAEELVVRADAPSIQLESSNASGRNYGFQANNDGNFHAYDATAGENRLTLDSSGNVGIGLTSPSSRAHVKGGSLTVEHGSPSTGTGQFNINSEIDSQATFSYDDEGVLAFGTATTPATQSGFIERMRIGPAGHLYSTCSDSSNAGLTLRKGSSGDSIDYLQCRDSGNTEKCTIKSDGDLENANNSYGSISDVKLKENIVDASSQWDDIKAIQVRNYNFKEDTGHETHKQLGVIAQEVETVSPGLVSESPDRETVQVPVLDENNEAVLDDNGEAIVVTEERLTGTVTKSVAYSVLYMKALKALQEAQTRIETLETQTADLLARVTALEATE